MLFVDTNVFVRHFTQDPPHLAARATAFLRQAEQGRLEITVTETVLLELIHILVGPSQPYHFDRSQAAAALRAILSLSGLRLVATDRRVYERAVDLYERNPIDFGDALIVSRMIEAGATEIVSYDRRHFDRLSGIVRREPE